MILFLDFDGVLHGIGRPEFENLPRLENLLREFELVDVVITSSWREIYPLNALVERFAHDLRHRIVGVTPVIERKWPPYPKHVRHQEIEAFLKGRETAGWLAIDDEANLFPPECTQLILCDSKTGLDSTVEQVIRKRLANHFAILVGNPSEFDTKC